jgi:hypothetical protein
VEAALTATKQANTAVSELPAQVLGAGTPFLHFIGFQLITRLNNKQNRDDFLAGAFYQLC